MQNRGTVSGGESGWGGGGGVVGIWDRRAQCEIECSAVTFERLESIKVA